MHYYKEMAVDYDKYAIRPFCLCIGLMASVCCCAVVAVVIVGVPLSVHHAVWLHAIRTSDSQTITGLFCIRHLAARVRRWLWLQAVGVAEHLGQREATYPRSVGIRQSSFQKDLEIYSLFHLCAIQLKVVFGCRLMKWAACGTQAVICECVGCTLCVVHVQRLFFFVRHNSRSWIVILSCVALLLSMRNQLMRMAHEFYYLHKTADNKRKEQHIVLVSLPLSNYSELTNWALQ